MDFVKDGLHLSASRMLQNRITVMPFEISRVSRIEIGFALLALPIVLWLILYLAHRWWSVNSRPALPWPRTVRWISWGLGVALFVVSLVSRKVAFDGIALLGCAAGLSTPERLIKRQSLR